MITHNDIILFIILTIASFFQGFYFGRRQMLMVIITSLILLFSSLVFIMLNGVDTYSGTILDSNIYEFVIGIIYAAFWLGFGYVMSHLVSIKETDFGVKRIKE